MLLPKECEKLIFSFLGIKYKKKCRATTKLNRICSSKCENEILCLKHKKILVNKDNNGLKLIANIALITIKFIYKYNPPKSSFIRHKIKIGRKWDYLVLY
tara:strand:+ start:411 stop:710 length:300 start_codon:yes stop_codon:yes gene_type:complete